MVRLCLLLLAAGAGAGAQGDWFSVETKETKETKTDRGVFLTFELINRSGRAVVGCDVETFGPGASLMGAIRVERFPNGVTKAKRIAVPGGVGMTSTAAGWKPQYRVRVARVRFAEGDEWRAAGVADGTP
ncbi:MAG: hypothetical protein SFV54_08000 [Bryobacteraceae bacterium]|nr:hypothetical protein [Bryobacteraceae bacterium]